MRLSNDSEEGRLLKAAVLRLAHSKGLTGNALVPLNSWLDVYEQTVDALALCMSSHGDQLSQWRGYADDGHGVAIGLSEEFLRASQQPTDVGGGLMLAKVLYDEREHEKSAEPLFTNLMRGHDELAAAIANGKRTQGAIQSKLFEILHHVMSALKELYAFKAAAFHEEDESRLISFLLKKATDPCKYHARRGALVPFRELMLRDKPEKMPSSIEHVFLGPKHETSPQEVTLMLLRLGYGDVRVERSSATYR
jgi:hypothetical protein